MWFLSLAWGVELDTLARSSHSCFVEDGRVACWGDNDAGELGNGTRADTVFPTRMLGVRDAASVAVSPGLTCVVTRHGRLTCRGVLGEASASKIGGFSAVTAAAVSQSGVCAIHHRGRVSCVVASDPHHPMPILEDATAIAAGNWGFCALRTDGDVACWNPALELVPNPVAVHGITVLASALFDDRWCGVRRDGGVDCWGSYGKVVPVDGVEHATTVAVGTTRSCAQRADGIVCWKDVNTPDFKSRALSAVVALPGSEHATLAGPSSHVCLSDPSNPDVCPADSWSDGLPGREISSLDPRDEDLAVLPGMSHGCAGAVPMWRCHYVFDGRHLEKTGLGKPTSAVHVFGEVAVLPPDGWQVAIGGGELVVSRITGTHAVIQAKIRLTDPDPSQPDGESWLLTEQEHAVWWDADTVHVVVTRRLVNPP